MRKVIYFVLWVVIIVFILIGLRCCNVKQCPPVALWKKQRNNQKITQAVDMNCSRISLNNRKILSNVSFFVTFLRLTDWMPVQSTGKIKFIRITIS